MPETIALIDYGAGNLRSVENALRAAGGNPTVTADAEIVRTADRVVLPGVGAFAACMSGLIAIPGMVEAMREAVLTRGVPFLGVCVGMQLLADAGHEYGVTPGLGWIAGDAYFLHSYVYDVADPATCLATTDHGGPITAAVGRDNIVGSQFHPEKSQAYGLAFLSRFLAWKP